MAFEKRDVDAESEAWNVAKYFTGKHIALPLGELNDLEDIARFGTLRQDEDLDMSEDQVDRRRAEAVKRYWQKLKQIIEDTRFKVKKEDRNIADDIHEAIISYRQYFDKLILQNIDDVNHDDQIRVNEQLLTLVLDALVDKKSQYQYVLDRAGLIFKKSADVDLDKIKEQFVHGG